MTSVTTKPEFSQPAIETSCGLFDWFDPIERDRVLKRGKTPVLTTDHARVLDSIDTLTVVGLGAWWYGNRVDESPLRYRHDRPVLS
jgi:hypothetical protein